MNQLEAIEGLDSIVVPDQLNENGHQISHPNTVLTDLWVNQNKIKSWESIKYLLNLKGLETVYLHSNPVAQMQAPEEIKEESIDDQSGIIVCKYTDWIIENMPWVQQIDSDNVELLKKRRSQPQKIDARKQ